MIATPVPPKPERAGGIVPCVARNVDRVARNGRFAVSGKDFASGDAPRAPVTPRRVAGAG